MQDVAGDLNSFLFKRKLPLALLTRGNWVCLRLQTNRKSFLNTRPLFARQLLQRDLAGALTIGSYGHYRL